MRDVKTGIVSRHFADGSAFHIGANPTDVQKAAGDASLRGAGYVLVDVPGGCEIEKD